MNRMGIRALIAIAALASLAIVLTVADELIKDGPVIGLLTQH
jgi:hypothetical protein